jgi:leucyl aminopeptidase
VYGKKSAEQKKQGKLTVHFDVPVQKRLAEQAIEEGRVLGCANNQVRFLAELPSNVLHPKSYRERAEKLAKELKVRFEFLGKKELLKKGAGAFLAVVQGDHHERAGIVHLHYSPSKKGKKKVALVGKGLCFDTGGYNVKTGDFMNGMHQDMTGSAVALSLFEALVRLEVPYEVHAYLALAENLIAFDAYRPNDVVIACNGVSIEVDNTDAEGRMCLSDTLAIASETKPDLLIDFATLTGSVIRSLDTRRCGAYSTDLKLSNRAVEAGERSGERVWNFPIGGDYFEAIKSDYADVRQCATSRAADHIYAATFLSKFVGKDIPWVHIDLAAGNNKGGLGLVPTETTGFGVRFGLEFIREVIGQ